MFGYIEPSSPVLLTLSTTWKPTTGLRVSARLVTRPVKFRERKTATKSAIVKTPNVTHALLDGSKTCRLLSIPQVGICGVIICTAELNTDWVYPWVAVAQPRLKSWGGPRFGSQHRGLGVGCGRRSPPPAVMVRRYHSRKIFWKLRCQILHSNDYTCCENSCFLKNTAKRLGNDTLLVPQPKSWGPVSPSPYGCCAYDGYGCSGAGRGGDGVPHFFPIKECIINALLLILGVSSLLCNYTAVHGLDIYQLLDDRLNFEKSLGYFTHLSHASHQTNKTTQNHLK